MTLKRKHLLYCLAFMAFVSTGLTKISASSQGYEASSEKDPKIMVGYLPATYQKSNGTHIEHIYFGGCHFKRVVNTFENIRCCRATYNKMDGCSLEITCPISE